MFYILIFMHIKILFSFIYFLILSDKHQVESNMTKHLFFIPLIGFGIMVSGCSKINETFQTLEENRQAVDMSTYAIQENIQAIHEANISIDRNRRQVEETTKALKKAGEG